MSLALFGQGLGLGAGLIIAIGAQNAYVLRQGLKRQHHIPIAAVCSLSDALLIVLGGVGVGTLIAATPILANGAAAVGAVFLIVYGFLAFRRAGLGEQLDSATTDAQPRTLKASILTALAFSILNPHALLDTVVLLGGISGQYDWHQRVWFLAGAVCASFAWFFTLAVGAGHLAPLFKKPRTWRILDTLIGLVMWSIAASLVNGAFF